MLRVCITIIAYIISFLSHSGELSEVPEQEGAGREKPQVEQLAKADSPAIEKKDVTLSVSSKSNSK